jgi:DeoR/GlpR family transcriptional regulator of sugar metabolism
MELTCGDDTLEQLSKYWADKLIIGMDGIDLVAGATTYNHAEDTVIARMMERSNTKILIVDDSKFGKVTFAHIAPLSAFDIIVTNYSQHNEQFYREAERMGLRVITE